MSKAFFIDTTRCTACRGCQIACKEWKGLPAEKTFQRGTHQNPPDLSGSTVKLVRFSEHLVNNKVEWYFFPDQCRHCVEAPCKYTAENAGVEGAIIKDEATGAIIYTELTKKFSKEQFEEIRESCPYDIPRRNEQTGMIVKCDMCIDRVQNNLLPMCVKTCPTGAMNFGAEQDMRKLAAERLNLIKQKYPKAKLIDPDEVNVIYLIVDDDAKYFASQPQQ